MRPSFLTAEWRKLAILNYSIDPSFLAPHLPAGTELDFWKGKCYVSLVAFRFVDVRLRGIKIPFHTDFEEINLRFYIKFKDGDEWKRGVTFIKEIVPKRAISFVANFLYNENYVTLPTKSSWQFLDTENQIDYKWKFEGKWDELSVTSLPSAIDILPGSEEEFITEHYWGATRVNQTRTSLYQVEHPKWQMYTVKDYKVNVRFARLYGQEFAFLGGTVPDSIMLAEGSPIVVRRSKAITAALH